jgi:glycosyltransferase involved in cell wall biosynthesis
VVTIVGDGPERPALEARAATLGVRATFRGNVPDTEALAAYDDADILAFPSLGDEWGLVVNEALAAGVPVLGSIYAQAVEELVIDGRNGWTMRPDDPADLSAALVRALTCPDEELVEMGRRARASVADLVPAVAARLLGDAVVAASEIHRGRQDEDRTADRYASR